MGVDYAQQCKRLGQTMKQRPGTLMILWKHLFTGFYAALCSNVTAVVVIILAFVSWWIYAIGWRL